MRSLSLDAARATGGPVTPAVGGALLAAGYDRDFSPPPQRGRVYAGGGPFPRPAYARFSPRRLPA